MFKMETIQGTQCTVDARSKLREKRFKKKTLPHNLISFSVFVFSRWCSCRKEHSVLVVVLKGRARCTQGGSLLSLGKKCLRIWSECCSQWLHKQLRYKNFELHTQRQGLLLPLLEEPVIPEKEMNQGGGQK